MSEEMKHPVILSKDFHIADLILRHIHGEVGHGGRNHTLSRLCQKYWIPGATVLIRKILSQCVFCRRINAIPGQRLIYPRIESLQMNHHSQTLESITLDPLE